MRFPSRSEPDDVVQQQEQFTLDAATEKRLKDLLAEMRSADDRHRGEVIEPVCARYKRMIAGRSRGERVSERSRDASRRHRARKRAK